MTGIVGLLSFLAILLMLTVRTLRLVMSGMDRTFALVAFALALVALTFGYSYGFRGDSAILLMLPALMLSSALHQPYRGASASARTGRPLRKARFAR